MTSAPSALHFLQPKALITKAGSTALSGTRAASSTNSYCKRECSRILGHLEEQRSR